MIIQIEEEEAYHTVVVCKTRSVEIGQKFPSVVFTRNGVLTEQANNDEGLEINYGINATKYQHGCHKIILGQGAFLFSIITEQEKKILNQSECINFDSFSCSKDLQFYFLSKDQELIQVIPDIISKEGTIFFKTSISHSSYLQDQKFKKITNSMMNTEQTNCEQHQSRLTYIFESQFAILSSVHFLNCFVNGWSPISHYVKLNQSTYVHCIDQSLLSIIKQRYLLAKL